MTSYNPLLLNCLDNELKEYINHNKETKEKVIKKFLEKDYECCVCLGGYIKEKKYVCIPFNCNHDICFSCFSELCHSTKKYTSDNLSKDIYCPLCREKPNKYWKNSERVSFQFYKYYDYNVYFTLPDI